MIVKLFLTLIIVTAAFSSTISAQEKTVVKDANARKMLLGKHLLSLQWISWDYFGAANIVNQKGVYYLKSSKNSVKELIM